MTNVVGNSREIQAELLAIVQRNNTKVTELTALPEEIRAQLDMQVFNDMMYLLHYINSLHAILEDVAEDEEEVEEPTFVFH